jgi:hypothetical protein
MVTCRSRWNLPPTRNPHARRRIAAPISQQEHYQFRAFFEPYDVRTDDGAHVGHNEDSTVKPGGSRTYRWYAGEPGVALLRSHAGAITMRMNF